MLKTSILDCRFCVYLIGTVKNREVLDLVQYEAPDYSGEIFDGPTIVGIFNLAQQRAAEQVQYDAPLLPDESAEDATYKNYLEAADLLESNDLSPRQRALSRLLVGTVVLYDDMFTAHELSRTFGTSLEAFYKVGSALAGNHDRFSPVTVRYHYRVPLVTEVFGTNKKQTRYTKSDALQWLSKESGRSSVIDQSVAEAAALFT